MVFFTKTIQKCSKIIGTVSFAGQLLAQGFWPLANVFDTFFAHFRLFLCSLQTNRNFETIIQEKNKNKKQVLLTGDTESLDVCGREKQYKNKQKNLN